MPSARLTKATAVKPGDLPSCLRLYRTSCQKEVIPIVMASFVPMESSRTKSGRGSRQESGVRLWDIRLGSGHSEAALKPRGLLAHHVNEVLLVLQAVIIQQLAIHHQWVAQLYGPRRGV